MSRFTRVSRSLAPLLVLMCTASLISATAGASKPDEKIDINTASVQELQLLPRVGPVVARRIVDYREKNGPFVEVTDLLNVKGIGGKIFKQIEDRITVSRGRRK
ncbi:MAG: ComEA family DNA-binding protein [Acidobacteriota bacterium]